MATTTTCSRTAGQLGRKRWITWQLWCVLLWQLCAGVEYRIKKDQVKVYSCAPCEIAIRKILNFNSTDLAQNGLELSFIFGSSEEDNSKSHIIITFFSYKNFSQNWLDQWSRVSYLTLNFLFDNYFDAAEQLAFQRLCGNKDTGSCQESRRNFWQKHDNGKPS